MNDDEDATTDKKRRAPEGRREPRGGEPAAEGAMLIRLARVRPGADRRSDTMDQGEDADDRPVPARADVPPPNAPRIGLPQRADVVRTSDTSPSLDRLVASSRRGPASGFLAFLLMVVLPTAIAAVYYTAVASPQYASEFRFSVRSQEGGSLDSKTTMASAVNPMTVLADNFLVSDFAESRDVVDRLEADIGLRRAYGSEHIDWLSRFDRSGSAEELVHYWSKMVDAHFDMTTGINVIAVRAFTPEDAQTMARALQRLCEDLVNSISEKARQTQMRYAEDQVARSEAKLRAIRARELEFRTRIRSVDASKTADAQIALASKIEGDLATIRTEYDLVSKYLEPGSPRLKVLRDQIASTEAQLAAVNSRVSGMDANNPAALTDAATISEFENIKTDAELALKIYEAALTSYEQARLRAVTDQLFLATFVQPSRPEEASRPRILLDTFMVFLAAIAAWVVSALVFYSVRDHAR